MRVLILAAIAAFAPVAAAQPGPRVVIEDDVSHDNAIKCSALRASQVQALADARATPDALLRNTHEAWGAYLKAQPGYDAAKAKAETEARMNSFKSSPGFYANPAAFLESLEKDCATFEIRSAN
ncbi:MAG: hypothetical protein QM773_07535 [Hyphomonadaceae bacterium]